IFPNDDSLLAEGTRKTHYVKADNLNVDFFTEILGYKDRAEPKEPVTVSWKVDGAGTLSKAIATNSDGYFTTTLTMPPVAGATDRISAMVVGGNAPAQYEKSIVVLPCAFRRT